MAKRSWDDFKRAFPELAEILIEFGAPLYEAGSIVAKTMPELQKLKKALDQATPEARKLLGLSKTNERELLLLVFELGPRILLRLERGGTC